MYQNWIKKGLEKGITDLEVFAVRNKSLKLSVYQQKLDQNVISDVESVTIRGIYDGKLSTVRFEYLDDDQVDAMLDKLKVNAQALTVNEPAIIFEGSPSYPKIDDEIYDFTAVDIKAKIQLLMDLEKDILAHPKTKQVQSTQYQENDTQTVLVNSKGLNLKKHNTYAYAYGIGVFEQDDDIKTAYDIKLVKSFDDFDAKKMAEETIQKGVAKLGGRSVASKAYPVVFSNEKFAEILSVFTSIFTGESAYRNLTALKEKVGEKIAIEGLNLIDDPLHEKAYFKQPFDDEGVACEKRYLVENGVFKGFIHNLKTAAIYQTKPTGHGFSGRISTTNFYLEPKELSFDQMISSIEDGIYITDLVGLHAGVKPVSGDFSLQASGFKIKDGKVDHPVKMIVVSGNFFKMIQSIQGIASDLEFTLSGTGSPSVFVGPLMIGGEA